MPSQEENAETLRIGEAFLNRFVDAFATFDGWRVAELFDTPCVALRSNGSLVLFANHDEVARYYQAALDGYHRDGCRAARWTAPEVAPMGRRALLATATWELLDDTGAVRRHWRQSYSLRNNEDGAAAFASAIHAD